MNYGPYCPIELAPPRTRHALSLVGVLACAVLCPGRGELHGRRRVRVIQQKCDRANAARDRRRLTEQERGRELQMLRAEEIVSR